MAYYLQEGSSMFAGRAEHKGLLIEINGFNPTEVRTHSSLMFGLKPLFSIVLTITGPCLKNVHPIFFHLFATGPFFCICKMTSFLQRSEAEEYITSGWIPWMRSFSRGFPSQLQLRKMRNKMASTNRVMSSPTCIPAEILTTRPANCCSKGHKTSGCGNI